MTLRNFIGAATLAAASILLGATLYWLMAEQYLAALVAMVCVVLCMELRVRMGWRMPRRPNFWVHIAGGGALLVVLGLLAWRPMPGTVFVVALLLLLAVALSGGELLVRQAVNLK